MAVQGHLKSYLHHTDIFATRFLFTNLLICSICILKGLGFFAQHFIHQKMSEATESTPLDTVPQDQPTNTKLKSKVSVDDIGTAAKSMLCSSWFILIFPRWNRKTRWLCNGLLIFSIHIIQLLWHICMTEIRYNLAGSEGMTNKTESNGTVNMTESVHGSSNQLQDTILIEAIISSFHWVGRIAAHVLLCERQCRIIEIFVIVTKMDGKCGENKKRKRFDWIIAIRTLADFLFGFRLIFVVLIYMFEFGNIFYDLYHGLAIFLLNEPKLFRLTASPILYLTLGIYYDLICGYENIFIKFMNDYADIDGERIEDANKKLLEIKKVHTGIEKNFGDRIFLAIAWMVIIDIVMNFIAIPHFDQWNMNRTGPMYGTRMDWMTQLARTSVYSLLLLLVAMRIDSVRSSIRNKYSKFQKSIIQHGSDSDSSVRLLMFEIEKQVNLPFTAGFKFLELSSSNLIKYMMEMFALFITLFNIINKFINKLI